MWYGAGGALHWDGDTLGPMRPNTNLVGVGGFNYSMELLCGSEC